MPVHGTGEQTRSLTYVDDIVGGILHVARVPMAALRPVNLGNDEELSVMEIARRVAAVCGVPFSARHLAPRPEDPQQRRPDLRAARGMDWAPTTSVEAGIRRTVDWFTAVTRADSAA
jgi:nucleoside-diphosphate-sugar epimerase